MIDTFALLLSHGMLVLVVIRLFKVDREASLKANGRQSKRPLPLRSGRPRA